MQIYEGFTFIHVPKTGGSFVRTALHDSVGKSLYGIYPSYQDVNLKSTLARTLYGKPTHSHTQGVGKKSVWKKSNVVTGRLLVRWGWIIRRTLCRLHPRWLPWLFGTHANCECIPSGHRHKLVLSTKRDPLAYHVSCYRYPGDKGWMGAFWWRRRYRQAVYEQQGKVDSGKEKVPEFGEFVRFFNEELPRIHFLRHKGYHLTPAIGFMSYLYIWYFFRKPEKVLAKTDEELTEYFQSGRYKQDMYRVHLLRTDHLNSDLHDFLLSQDFDRKALRVVLEQEKTNATRGVTGSTDPEAYFTPALADYVREKNRIYCRYFWRDGSVEPVEPCGRA